MKIFFKALTLLAAVLFVRCSDEQIEPTPLGEDMATSANAYVSGAFTLSITTQKSHPDNDYTEPVTFFLSGTTGSISVNWGDGKIEKHRLGTQQLELYHQYANQKNYTIQITGELAAVTDLEMNYQHVHFRDFNLSGAKNLKSFRYNLNFMSPATINFSHNRLIEEILLVAAIQTTDVIIPPTNSLRAIDLSNCTGLSTAVVDRVIARVYDSVKAKPRKGFFGMLADWSDDQTSTERIGPPSPYSMTKLRTLQNTYNWAISPNP